MPKIRFHGSIPVEHEVILANMEHCKSLGLPRVALGQQKREGRLAVCGGGPSLLDHIEQLRGYPEIWAVNGTCRLLRERGIDSWLFAVDPHLRTAEWASGASKALLCNRVDPSVFEALKDAEVLVYELQNDTPAGVMAGSSTASVAFHLGIECGWTGIDFFGCESSFGKQTHAYQNENRRYLLWVECGGKEYLTAPDFYLQATEMSTIIRTFRNNFRHFGGGLLQAMIDDPEHDITHASPQMMAMLEPA